ncbi:hypothetical protein BLNAU_16042 [Blattamonas nauphoetae]|uniref:Uncharacterized protein n=1 Tax=Blattamonas nauphoetae TaxID=2049346 RepID=A0ABQ9X901_9EUKA|nr:hypothetical protein BLNAU_16042 [Blattamonas nauphoetae]
MRRWKRLRTRGSGRSKVWTSEHSSQSTKIKHKKTRQSERKGKTSQNQKTRHSSLLKLPRRSHSKWSHRFHSPPPKMHSQDSQPLSPVRQAPANSSTSPSPLLSQAPSPPHQNSAHHVKWRSSHSTPSSSSSLPAEGQHSPRAGLSGQPTSPPSSPRTTTPPSPSPSATLTSTGLFRRHSARSRSTLCRTF